MNAWNVSNSATWVEKTAVNAKLKAEAQLFWPSEKGVVANKELVSLLADSPVLLTQLYEFAGKHGIPGKKSFFDGNSGIEIRRQGQTIIWCGLKGKDETYWAAINSPSETRIESAKIKRFPNTIPNMPLGMQNADNSNNFSGQSIRVNDDNAREFWASQNGAAAEKELVELLSESAKPTTDSGLIAWSQKNHLPLFKNSLNVAYIRTNDKFVSKPVGSNFWCGLAEKNEPDKE